MYISHVKKELYIHIMYIHEKRDLTEELKYIYI